MKLIDRFKHRKPKVYIYFGIYVFLVLFIIVESCMGASLSGSQSNLFAQFSSWLVNLFKGPQVVEVLEPTSISLKSDSSVLGTDSEGYAHIALGTTTLAQFEVKFPEKKHEDDTLHKEYTIVLTEGNEDDFNIVSNTVVDANSLTLQARIVALKKTSESYKLNIGLANNVNAQYKFKIVNLEKPTIFDARLTKTNLKIDESSTIDVKIKDNKDDSLYIGYYQYFKDAYYKRYYDTTLIEHSSDNPNVATVDEFGVVRGISNGNTTIHYGDKSFNITVGNESIVNPDGNTITISKSANANPNLLDYDYIHMKEEPGKDLYSTVLKANFSNTTLTDKSVTWTINTTLKAKIGPYKYDELGYPVYEDESGNPSIRVSGYREKGEIKVTCISNANKDIKKETTLNVGEAVATDFKVNTTDFSISLGEQKIIKVDLEGFTPRNVNNKNINISCSDSDAFIFTNNNSSDVTLLANKMGNFKLVIKSLSNESVKKEINVEVTAKQAINEYNFSSFAQFMRKFAGHMLLFLVTSIFGFLFFFNFFDDKKRRFLFAICCTLVVSILTAGLSELIQLMVPTRSGTFLDIGIDILGSVIGIILVSAVYWSVYLIKKFIREKKDGSNREE